MLALAKLHKSFLLVVVLTVSLFSGLFLTTNTVAAPTTPADEACAAVTALGGDCTGTTAQTGITGTITKVINVMSFIVGIISVIMLIIAGIRFTTSGGDPQAASGARQTIIYAIIGIVIVIMAQTIVAFVLNRIK